MKGLSKLTAVITGSALTLAPMMISANAASKVSTRSLLSGLPVMAEHSAGYSSPEVSAVGLMLTTTSVILGTRFSTVRPALVRESRQDVNLWEVDGSLNTMERFSLRLRAWISVSYTHLRAHE